MVYFWKPIAFFLRIFCCCGPQICPHEVWDLLKFFCDLPGWKLRSKHVSPIFVRSLWPKDAKGKISGLTVDSNYWFAPEGLKSSFMRAFHWHQDINHNPLESLEWNIMKCDLAYNLFACVLKHAKHRVGILPPQQLALLWRRPVLPLQEIARTSHGKTPKPSPKAPLNSKHSLDVIHRFTSFNSCIIVEFHPTSSCHFQTLWIKFHQDLHQASKVVKRSSPEWNALAFDAPPCPPPEYFFPFRMMPRNQIWIAQIKCIMALSSHSASKRFSS